MGDATIGTDLDWEGWVAPSPEALPTYTALIKPLQPLVWALMVVIMFVTAFSIFVLGRTEGELNGKGCPHDWKTLKATSWYCFGTLLGESITRDTKSEHLAGLRYPNAKKLVVAKRHKIILELSLLAGSCSAWS